MNVALLRGIHTEKGEETVGELDKVVRVVAARQCL